MKTKFISNCIVFVLFLSGFNSFSQSGKKSISLDDIFKARKFSSKGGGSFVSMNDGDHYCQVIKDSLNTYVYATGALSGTIVTAARLIPAGSQEPIEMGSFIFSDDETKILFATDEEPIYRRSSRAMYYIYDRATGKLDPLSGGGKQRLATFSPDGKNVAFVRDNNIFIRNLASGTETQVTTDGKVNEIINGATDWVYEEEFEFSQAYFWSPDSKRIAFYTFDERKVREYELTYYGDLYPEQYKYKYPKAGESNSIISVSIFELSSARTVSVFLGDDPDIYIPRVKWTADPSLLSFYRMNRHQNKLELMFADARTGETHPVYTEENKYYIEVNDDLTFLENGKQFLLSNEKDGFRHLYLFNIDGTPVRQITRGPWEVGTLYGVDEGKGLIYYSSDEASPLEKNIYSISLEGTGKTCLTPAKGTNSATFSSKFKWFVNRWSDINTPPVITVNRPDGVVERTVQDNSKLKELIQEYNFGKVDFFSFTTGDGIQLNGWMLKPANFDPLKKYPVLFTIYGGPGSQTVSNVWGSASSWNQLLAQHGIIVVSVDNRGTGGRGEEFKKMTYLQLGKYETIDQVEAAKYLGGLPYVDKAHIGMWGWSFGGYLTLSCLTRGADYFSMGVAVAPVTNWKYYDNIYTERFMRTPGENNSGYEDNSPVNQAALLKGKLLMIHGMADDNVHPQNSYDMITALVAADKQFDVMVYPNSNHGIYTGKNTTIQLYTKMTNFIITNLTGQE
jgi:dipeptidyl-peptidase 4